MQSYFLRRAVSQTARSTVNLSRTTSAVSVSRSRSGLQRPTSQQQLRPKPSTTGRGRPVKGSSAWNRSNESRKCKYFAFVMTLLLFTGAIVMIILYFLKQKKLSEKANTIVAIRKSMIHHNRSLEGKSDAEILAAAQQLAKSLLDWKWQNYEIQRTLDSTIEKLARGWKPFSGALYYFSTSTRTLQQAWQECQGLGGNLIDILSAEEEDFVEAETAHDYSAYWLGLRFLNGIWTWLTNQPVTSL